MKHQVIKLQPDPRPDWNDIRDQWEMTLPVVPVAPERLAKLQIAEAAAAPTLKRASIPGDVGKTMIVDIGPVYGINPDNGSRQLNQDFTVATAQAEFPFMWAAKKRESWSDDKIMSLTRFEAAHSDALWWNGVFIPLSDARGIAITRNTILYPNGPYWTVDQLDMANATRHFGTGTAGSDLPSKLGQTHIVMDGARWIGNRNAAFGWRHFSAGTASFFGYSEGFQWGNFRITGFADKYKLAGRTVTGIEMWDTGEGCHILGAFVDKCDIGYDFVRGTPTCGDSVLSAFENTEAGICFTGASGATIAMRVSGDDNSDLIRVRPGYGRPGGVGGSITMVKSEMGISPARTFRPQRLLNAEGWVRLVFGFVSHANGNVFQNDLIQINPSVNTSHIVIEDLREFGGDNLGAILHDTLNNKLWKYDNGWMSRRIRVEYFSDQQGMLFAYPESLELQANGTYALRQIAHVNAPYDNRTGFILGDPNTGRPVGSFNLTTGTPSWTDEAGNGGTDGGGTIPPPVPAPVIDSFTVAPATSTSGAAVTLSWQTTGATKVEINGIGTVAVDGTRVVNPTSTTVYTLTATNSAGVSVTATVTVNIPTSTAPAFASTFAGSGPNLVASTGASIAPANADSAGSFANGVITTRGATSYPWAAGRASRVVLKGVTLQLATPNYQNLTANHILYPGGKIIYRRVPGDISTDVDTGLVVALNTRIETLTLPCPGGNLSTVLGAPVGTGATAPMRIESMEVYL